MGKLIDEIFLIFIGISVIVGGLLVSGLLVGGLLVSGVVLLVKYFS